jgi:hypothetical protein
MRRLLLFTSIALVSACTAAPAPQPMNSPSQPTAPSTAPPVGSPAGSAGASANAPTAPLDDKVAEAKAAFDKNPSDTAAKKAYTDAMFQNAEYYMYTSPAPPNQKYPKALALYRQVLKLEPDNVRAKESAEIIEGIYRQMGRPVPEV